MALVRVHSFAISIDGYGAGPVQSLTDPLGAGGMALHQWAFATRTFRAIHGGEGGSTGIDDQFIARGFENIGAWIVGRNMFGPPRGPWTDDGWKGWWGEEPPFHSPVFVITNHARPALTMSGGTTFHFESRGIDAALKQASAAAGGKDVRIGGGVATVRQFLRARLIDEMHVAIAPVLLGLGEHLLSGIDLCNLGYVLAEHVQTPGATHLVIKRAR